MNRTFHARIAAAHYAFLLVATAAALYGLWQRHAVLAAVFAFLLVVAIERLIHTTYTLTPDGRLLVYYGRFARGKAIRLSSVVAVERVSSMRVGRFALMRYVLVRYGRGQCVALLPDDEEAFVRALEGRRGNGLPPRSGCPIE